MSEIKMRISNYSEIKQIGFKIVKSAMLFGRTIVDDLDE